MFLSAWHQASSWFAQALSGMATPGVIALVLALTTLLLEDLAIAAGVALAAQGAISWGLSLFAVGAGIAVGDLALYGVGLLATRMPWLQRRYVGAKSAWAREKIVRRLSSAVLLARVIPGLRLATYTTCGFVRVPFIPFSLWVLLAVALWTVSLYVLSAAIGQTLACTLGLPAPLAVALPIIVLALAVPLWQRWQVLRQRRNPVAANPTNSP